MGFGHRPEPPHAPGDQARGRTQPGHPMLPTGLSALRARSASRRRSAPSSGCGATACGLPAPDWPGRADSSGEFAGPSRRCADGPDGPEPGHSGEGPLGIAEGGSLGDSREKNAAAFVTMLRSSSKRAFSRPQALTLAGQGGPFAGAGERCFPPGPRVPSATSTEGCSTSQAHGPLLQPGGRRISRVGDRSA